MITEKIQNKTDPSNTRYAKLQNYDSQILDMQSCKTVTVAIKFIILFPGNKYGNKSSSFLGTLIR